MKKPPCFGIKQGGDVFFDLGFGKGRIVTVVATHPFMKVIGVELLSNLNEAARENIDRAKNRLVWPDIEIVEYDVTKCDWLQLRNELPVSRWVAMRFRFYESFQRTVRSSDLPARDP